MKRLYKTEDAFEAEIRVLSPEEGGRKRPFHNGIRWDFVYKEYDPERKVHMIWPDFMDENQDSYDSGLFLSGTLLARMHIVMEEMIPFHKKKIDVGTEFYCVEGPLKVAIGVVTKVTGLKE